MKKNTTTTFRLSSLAVVFFAAVSMVGCSGDDGAVGPAGVDGTNGTNGTDGVGFAEAKENGGIEWIVEGTRPDGVAFKDTLTFAYSPSDLSNSRLTRNATETDANSDNYVYLERYESWDGTHGAGQIYTYNEAQLDGTVEARYFQHNFYTNVKFPAEKKYFYLEVYAYYNFYNNGEGGTGTETNLSNVTLDYKRPITNGVFTYKASFTVPAENNSSGSDLKVTAITNAIVYESINEGGEGGRTSSHAISDVKAVKKATMESMN